MILTSAGLSPWVTPYYCQPPAVRVEGPHPTQATWRPTRNCSGTTCPRQFFTNSESGLDGAWDPEWEHFTSFGLQGKGILAGHRQEPVTGIGGPGGWSVAQGNSTRSGKGELHAYVFFLFLFKLIFNSLHKE